MGIDWGFAGQIGGVGFGVVFVLLIMLAVAIWLVGLRFGKSKTAADETSNKKKGA